MNGKLFRFSKDAWEACECVMQEKNQTFEPLEGLGAADVHPESCQLLLPELLLGHGSLVSRQLLDEGLRLGKTSNRGN